MLLADEDVELRAAWEQALRERCANLVVLHAADAAAASEQLLLGHPHLVIASLRLAGHAQGGYRVILDAASLGLPSVLVSRPIAEPLRHRLDELGILWIARDTGPTGLALASLALLPSVPQAPLALSRDEAFVPVSALPPHAPLPRETPRAAEVRVPLPVTTSSPPSSLAEAV